MAGRKLLVADLLCGAGGTSSGALDALKELGLDAQLIGLNHWRVAVETFRLNFPSARVHCQDIAAARPIEEVPEGYLDLLMASPTCTHHSRARGGRPTSDQQRSDPWHIITWLTELRVKRLLIENVPEFRDWGPVDRRTGKPMKSRKGEYFRAWLDTIKGLGFRCEYRILNSADFGGATTRQRFFLLARSDRERLWFPPPSHSKTATFDLVSGKRERWRAAKEIIDWNLPGRSIFTRPRDLAPKTMARIWAGAVKFGWPEPYLVILRQHCDARSIELPVPTVTASGNHIGLAQPSLTPFVLAQGQGGTARGVDGPMPTIVAGGAVSVTEPVAQPFVIGNRAHNVAKSTDEPVPGITTATGGGVAIAEPVIVKMKGRSDVASADDPAPTIATRSQLGIAQPMISPYYGSGSGETCKSVEQPLDTVTAKPRFGMVEPVAKPFMLPQQGDDTGRAPRVLDVDAPTPTVTTVARIGVVEAAAKPFLAAHFGERPGQEPRTHDVDNPFPTVTHRGAGDLVEGTATPIVVQTDQTGGRGTYARSAEEPIYPPVTKQNQALVEAVLEAAGEDEDLRIAIDQRRVFLVDGVPHVFDIRFRMLEDYELARAMGFDPGYKFAGNKTERTRQVGNAVEHYQAKALVKALFSDPPGARHITAEAAE